MAPLHRMAQVAWLLSGLAVGGAQDGWRALFDGHSLAGWETVPADRGFWSVADGVLRGGSLEREQPRNTFLATTGSYADFELRLEIRVLGSQGFINSGVQVRSVRVPDSSEMSGYQVDAGDGWWGKLYDESRRDRVLAQAADLAAVEAAVRPGDWNAYRIRAEGRRLQSWINGVAALDYSEVEDGIALAGHIGIQVHGGGRALVEVRDVQLLELPPVTRARTPAEERAGFQCPEGFEVELVACEPDIRKVVDIAFDDRARLWAITAVEYPIDGNESPAAAELYRRGGRDQVLVFDDISGPGPHSPRVFADGLAIPLALLPEGDSVYVGQGPQILRLSDSDGDGRADRREVLLDGFGIDDSHLMPHRFVRAPGGWIYLAQGAFNSSRVVTASGQVVPFERCKLGRFRRDGSSFETVGVGLNNIWGFVIDRSGDKWIQEANDLGYPVVPFEHGASYPGIGSERYRPYAPWQPALADFRMGGTGLSGLARSQDRNGFPAPWDQLFLLANPILNAIQSVAVERAGSELQLTRGPDLLTSADTNFRPVAIHFGPDGCLYVVDWYNPIISHNEVPRDHPDRDRTHSRIWRIRHSSQPARPARDVAAVPSAQLPALLDSDSTLESRAAWHQIGARRAFELEAPLRALALDPRKRVEARVLALWSLEELQRIDAELLAALLGERDHALRREAARLGAGLELGSDQLAALLAPLADERDGRVRLALIEALDGSAVLEPGAAWILLGLVRAPVAEPIGLAAEIALERCLVRAAFEDQPDALRAVLDSRGAQDLDADTFLYAALCLGGGEGAERLARGLIASERGPSAEELAFLGAHASADQLRAVVARWIARPATRADGLRTLLASLDAWDSAELEPQVVEALRALLTDDPTPGQRELFLQLARAMRLGALEGEVLELLDSGQADRLECLRTLVEIGSPDAPLYFELAASSVPGSEFQRVAATALAGVPTAEAFERLLELWPALDAGLRRAALGELLTRRAGAERLVAALVAEQVGLEALDATCWARLDEHLGEHAALIELRAHAARDQLPLLFLGGQGDDYAATQLTLSGPFTLEAWLQLDAGLSNADGLLCAPGTFDLNFHDARPRLWVPAAGGDVLIATRRVEAERWFHLALTRDDADRLALYLDGELDARGKRPVPGRFEGLDVGRTNPAAGTAGRITQLRVWDRARSAAEIGATFRLALEPGGDGPRLVLPGSPALLHGGARIAGSLDRPALLSRAQAEAERERFESFRALASQGGDPERGRALFDTNCAACHQVAGRGTSIGPVLDGVAHKGSEGLLRSILTPNAGVESGYRTLIVRTRAGETLTGFLAGEDAASILLRRRDREDLRIPRAELESLRFDSLSLMPEGLLDALSPAEVRDLLAYLQSLR